MCQVVVKVVVIAGKRQVPIPNERVRGCLQSSRIERTAAGVFFFAGVSGALYSELNIWIVDIILYLRLQL